MYWIPRGRRRRLDRAVAGPKEGVGEKKNMWLAAFAARSLFLRFSVSAHNNNNIIHIVHMSNTHTHSPVLYTLCIIIVYFYAIMWVCVVLSDRARHLIFFRFDATPSDRGRVQRKQPLACTRVTAATGIIIVVYRRRRRSEESARAFFRGTTRHIII